MGGYNGKDNIVKLTAPEHYVAHQLLVMMYPKSRGLVIAAIGMASGYSKNMDGRSGNKLYGWLKTELSKRPMSNSAKDKIAAAAKQRGPLSVEHRKRISESGKGLKRKPFSDSHRLNISKGHKGLIRTVEYCDNMRKVKTGTKMPPVTDEWREKQRAARIGKPLPEQWKANLNKSRKGRKHSEETKEKIRQAATGRVMDKDSKKWIKKSEKLIKYAV